MISRSRQSSPWARRGAAGPTLSNHVALPPTTAPPLAQAGSGRTERVEPLGPPPLAVFLLEVAAGDVVDAGVPGDRAHRLGRAEIPSPGPDDHPDLRFELHSLGDARQPDNVTITDEGGRRLDEDDGGRGHRVAQLLRVGHVVAADADDLRGAQRGHTMAPIPCLAKKSSHFVRTWLQVPTTRSALGSPPSSMG